MPNQKNNKSSKQPKRARKTRPSSVAVAYGNKMTTSQPQFYMRGDKICVRHREYVQDIFADASNEFAYDVFQISPTNATTHPWLASIAQNFETSRYLGFASVFKTGSASSCSGKLIMAVDYDADDPDTAVSKADMLQWPGTSSDNYWRDSRMTCSSKGLNTIGPMKFNQDGNTSDARLSTSGLLYVATTSSNLQANGSSYIQANFGELWVEYDVELGFPTVDSTLLRTALRPQMEEKKLITASLSSSMNLFAGATPASSPTTTELIEPYGIRFVDAGANEYLVAGTTNLFAATGTPLLVFDKDFQGPFSITTAGATSAVVPGSVSADQYSRAQQIGTSTARGQDVDFDSNIVYTTIDSTVTSSTGALNYVVSGFIRAAKGTAIRLLGSAITAAGSNIVKAFIFGSANPYKPKGDLLGSGNLLASKPSPTPQTNSITF